MNTTDSTSTPRLGKSLQQKSVVDQIVDTLTDAIINGQLKPGDKLPTEPQLCADFEVGRNSVREAIKKLESYGVVYIKRAEGTFVNDNYTQKMLDPMLYGILLQQSFSKDIIELRKVLDIGILQLCIKKSQSSDFALLDNALLSLENILSKFPNNADKILEADIAFHMAITRTIDNQMLLSMYSYVDRITIPSRQNAVKLALSQGTTKSFIQMHRDIINIIKNGDIAAVESVISEHYTFWKLVS